jgi:transposase
MQAITTIGLDIAKSVFQVHGVDADGHVIIRRQLKRRGRRAKRGWLRTLRSSIRGEKAATVH